MSKKSIVAVLMMIFSIGIISMYTTYAFDNEVGTLGESTADHNLIYSISENSNRQISLMAGETKFVDIALTNTLSSPIEYGMYYYAITPDVLPSGVKISLADSSSSPLDDIIDVDEEKVVSLKLTNDSEYNVMLLVGALIGFENGDISELETDKQILIK